MEAVKAVEDVFIQSLTLIHQILNTQRLYVDSMQTSEAAVFGQFYPFFLFFSSSFCFLFFFLFAALDTEDEE